MASLKALTQEAKRTVTYRVQGIPVGYDWKSSKILLEATFGFDLGQSDIKVHSLAESAVHKGEKSATITSESIREGLGENFRERTFEIPDTFGDIQDDNRPRVQDVVIDNHFEGFTTLSAVDDLSVEAIDYIAVCGLGGHAFGSFKEKGGNHMWLRDSLPFDLENARVLTYGYSSQVYNSKSFQDLEALASTFRRSLIALRRPAQRPIILIAHSLGGLIVKEAIVQLSQSGDDRAARTLKAIYGILFFGCPNQGMKVSSLLPMCDGKPNDRLLHCLDENSERLRQLSHSFPIAFPFPDSKIISFYETELSPTAVQRSDGQWVMNGPLECLVSIASATHGRPGEQKTQDVQAINKNHSEIVKFSRRDLNYKIVLDLLEDFASSATQAIDLRFDGIPQLTQPQILGSLEQVKAPDLVLQAPVDQTTESFKTAIRWITPEAHECNYYLDDLEGANSLRHPETCTWICRKQEYINWLHSSRASEMSMLWIYAIPGAGKTVIASYLIEQLSTQTSLEPKLTLFFFFQNTDSDKNTPLAATRALMHQLLLCKDFTIVREILKDISSYIDSSGQLKALNFRSLWDLFCRSCERLSTITIVLDALDECNQADVLINGLLKLKKITATKILVTSRNEPGLRKALKNVPRIEAGQNETQEDIEAYIEHTVSESSILSNTRVCEQVSWLLKTKSQGMFLWAVLMIKELESKSTITEIETALTSLPEGLDGVYKGILARLFQTLKPSRRRFCRTVLKWICLVVRPLRLEELDAALKVDYALESGQSVANSDLLLSVSEMELVCGSLISVRRGVIQLIHLSTRDFLRACRWESAVGSKPAERFIDTEYDSAYIAACCTAYLNDEYTRQGPIENEETIQHWNNVSPFLEYTAVNWITHVTNSTTEAIKICERFMQPFLRSRASLNWIELCYYLFPEANVQLRAKLQMLVDCFENEILPSVQPDFSRREYLLQYWASCCLRLIVDYGLTLIHRHSEVRQIDPGRIFKPDKYNIVKNIQNSGNFDKHVILDGIGQAPEEKPRNRCLQENTSSDPGYALFHFDQRRGCFLTLDKFPLRAPQLYCQQAATGRRLSPIPDPDFNMNCPNLLVHRASGAATSPDGNYVGIVYFLVPPPSREYLAEFGIFYTVVWALETLQFFQGPDSKPWARKAISSSSFKVGRRSPATLCSQLFAFADNNHVYCPSGLIDLRSGKVWSSQLYEDLLGNSALTFCGPGQKVVRYGGWKRDDTITVYSLSANARHTQLRLEVIDSEVTDAGSTVYAVSTTGRYFAYTRPIDNGKDWYLFLRDTMKQQTTFLGPGPQSMWRTANSVIFSKSEELLFAVVDRINPLATNSTEIHWWRIDSDGSIIHRNNSYSLQDEIMALSFAESDQSLYIVSKQLIWGKMDIDTPFLKFLDPFPSKKLDFPTFFQIWQCQEETSLFTFEHRISDIVIEGLKLCPSYQTIANQSFNKRPPWAYAAGVMSPDRSVLFLGNTIFRFANPDDPRPLILPMPAAHRQAHSPADGGFWRCGFTPDSNFLFACFRPEHFTNSKCPGLHIFAIDSEIWHFKQISISQLGYYAINELRDLRVACHPKFPELAILYEAKDTFNETNDHSVNFVILEFSSSKKDSFCSFKHFDFPRAFPIISIKYSACGSYIFTLRTHLHHGGVIHKAMRWPIPWRSPPPAPHIHRPHLLRSGEYASWGGIVITCNSNGRMYQLVIELCCLENPENSERQFLTCFPAYLVGSNVTVLLGNTKDPEMRILFCQRGRHPEMKYLGFTLDEYLGRFEMLRGGRGKAAWVGV